MTDNHAEQDANLTLEDAISRIDLLERRLKRIVAERNKARSDFARLAAAAQPFANHTARSMRGLLDDIAPDEFYRLSKTLLTCITADSNHAAIGQVLALSETLAAELDNRRRGSANAVDIDLCADRILRKLEQVYQSDKKS
jgi:hypothetical protein